jgi:hypothetical protein
MIRQHKYTMAGEAADVPHVVEERERNIEDTSGGDAGPASDMAGMMQAR